MPSLTQLLIPRESRPGETRVAASPETVQRFCARGLRVRVETAAGAAAGFSDQAYAEAGAELLPPDHGAWAEADVVLCVHPPAEEQLQQLPNGAVLIGLLAPYEAHSLARLLNSRRVSALALELLPRISRAQTMDVLSSQASSTAL